jgi:transcriptional regulator with XRE-family HTH domain
MGISDAGRLGERVARAVRAELERRQMTQTELATLMGRQQQWLNRRLVGEVAFGVDELAEVATALGVPVAWFVLATGSAA